MIPLQRSTALALILDTPKAGRGVFASRPIPAGTVLDTCPVLLLEPADITPSSTLFHYSYNWPVGNGAVQQALILGLGSMFNHSVIRQNVGWRRDVEAGLVVYTTLRDIREGEELLISYGARLTFVDVEAKVLEEMRREEEEAEKGNPLGGIDFDGL